MCVHSCWMGGFLITRFKNETEGQTRDECLKEPPPQSKKGELTDSKWEPPSHDCPPWLAATIQQLSTLAWNHHPTTAHSGLEPCTWHTGVGTTPWLATIPMIPQPWTATAHRQRSQAAVTAHRPHSLPALLGQLKDGTVNPKALKPQPRAGTPEGHRAGRKGSQPSSFQGQRAGFPRPPPPQDPWE